MPFYRYDCAKCRNEFRVLRRSDEENSVSCPRCGSTKTTLLLPRIGVIYKGKGYYSTDYRKTKSDTASRANTKGPMSVADD
jgi:putative FmdB family regulatory protein